MLRVGLTGGIASGKSTIRRTLARLGCITVDADQIVAALYEPAQAGHTAIVRQYGDEVLLDDGRIDRTKLAQRAFASAEEAKRLNALIHPLVIAEEARLMREAEADAHAATAIYVVEATLLLESGGRERYERIVVVDLPVEVQVERAVARGMRRDEVLRRIDHQMSREERLRSADYVIDNSGTKEHAENETRRVYESLRRDAQKKSPGLAPGADTTLR